MSNLSVNRNALKIVKEILDRADEYCVRVEKNELGTYIIDAGIRAEGGLLIGKKIIEACLGGLCETRIYPYLLETISLLSIFVYTDQPVISTIGSQLAGWHIKVDDYSAIGSGPARALALKPKSFYEKIGYRDKSDVAVLVLETDRVPTTEAVRFISDSCHVTPEKLFLVLVPTASISGVTQISGRIAEAGIYRLFKLGLDLSTVKCAWGYAPIMPVHPDPTECMGRANDAILYGGVAGCVVKFEDDQALADLISQAVSSSSKEYGRPFKEIFLDANSDFYKIDPNLFAPALFTIQNVKTGKIFTAGKVNTDLLKRSIGL